MKRTTITVTVLAVLTLLAPTAAGDPGDFFAFQPNLDDHHPYQGEWLRVCAVNDFVNSTLRVNYPDDSTVSQTVDTEDCSVIELNQTGVYTFRYDSDAGGLGGGEETVNAFVGVREKPADRVRLTNDPFNVRLGNDPLNLSTDQNITITGNQTFNNTSEFGGFEPFVIDPLDEGETTFLFIGFVVLFVSAFYGWIAPAVVSVMAIPSPIFASQGIWYPIDITSYAILLVIALVLQMATRTFLPSKEGGTV